MKYFLSLIISFLTVSEGYSQNNDSTDKFKSYPLETITITNEWISEDNTDTFRIAGASDRASFLILDPELRHCFVTARLIEYKDGKKIKEKIVLSKEAIYKNPQLASFEDSSFVFSLYRKQKNNGRFIWGFRTPSIMSVEEIEMTNPEDYVTTLADPLQQKLPIGKPFVFLVITSPDNTRNFNFFRKENKNKFRPYDWNKNFGLKHSFIIELTIEKSQDYKQNENLLKSSSFPSVRPLSQPMC